MPKRKNRKSIELTVFLLFLVGSGPAMAQANQPPMVVSPIPDILDNYHTIPLSIDLDTVFSDPDAGQFETLNYTFSETADTVSRIWLSNSVLGLGRGSPGTSEVTLVATDAGGAEMALSFTYRLNAIPTAVAFPDVLLDLTFQDTTLNLNHFFEDPEEEELSFSISLSDSSILEAMLDGHLLTLTSRARVGSTSIDIDVVDASGGINRIRGYDFLIFEHLPVVTTLSSSEDSLFVGTLISGVADSLDARHFGSSISIGDMDGDGIDDISIATGRYFTPLQNSSDGRISVILSPEPFPDSTLNLSEVEDDRVFHIYGENGINGRVNIGKNSDFADINDDGFDDLVFRGDGGQSGISEITVVYGAPRGDLRDINVDTLSASKGFRVRFSDLIPSAHFGLSITGIRDFNGDGIEDLAFSHPNAFINSNPSLHVIFGRDDNSFPIQLLTDEIVDNVGLTFIEDSFVRDEFATSIADIGDINGDGLSDLAVGSQSFDPSLSSVQVVFGTETTSATPINLSAPDGWDGFKIQGSEALGTIGYGINGLGDLNLDGFDDFAFHTGEDVFNPDTALSRVFIIFGSENLDPGPDFLDQLDGSNGFQIINYEDDGLGVSAQLGDINLDGFPDFAISVSTADILGNGSGAIYVINGREKYPAVIDLGHFSSEDGLLIAGPESESIGTLQKRPLDLGNDGIPDIIFGSSAASVDGVVRAGKAYYLEGGNFFKVRESPKIPVVVQPIGDKVLQVGFGAFSINLDNIFSDQDQPNLIYTTTSSDPGVASAVVNDRELILTEVTPGKVKIQVIAENIEGNTASSSFDLLVNQSPSILNPIEDQLFQAGFQRSTMDISSVFQDPESHDMSVDVSLVPESIATVSLEGPTLILDELSPGSGSITLTANDGHGGVSSTTFDLLINRAPVVTEPLDDKLFQRGFGMASLDLANLFQDPDSQSISTQASSQDTAVVQVSVVDKSLVVEERGAGNSQITLNASDGFGGSATTEFNLRVNRAPTISSELSNLTLDEGFGLFNLDLVGSFADVDGDELLLRTESTNENVVEVQISGSDLMITEIGIGEADIIVSAEDGYGAVAMDTFGVEVVTVLQVKEESSNDIKIYPNPATDEVFIEFIHFPSTKGTWRLLDVSGAILVESQFENHRRMSISMVSFPCGLYLLYLQMAGHTVVRRIEKN